MIKDIYGNKKLLNFFESALNNGKLAHAYILEGRQNSGKHTLATALSAALNCQSRNSDTFPCGLCESCRKIRNKRNRS